MAEINSAKQESSALNKWKIVVKKGNNAQESGEVCPYCGSKDTDLLDDFVDEKACVASEAWQCGACGATFHREAKLAEDRRTIISSKTYAGAMAMAASNVSLLKSEG